MAFDFNEARSIIEDAKKRGIIRESGDLTPPAPSPKSAEEQAKITVLPDWLKDSIKEPPRSSRPESPVWRSE